MFSLKQICSNIVVDKTTTTKNTNKSSAFSQSMRYSKYVNLNSRNYYKVTETGIISLTVSSITAKSAVVSYTYYSKPAYINMIVTNIQDMTDTHTYTVLDSPFTMTGLLANSYYTITTYTVFNSENRYLKVFEKAIFTLLEGPPEGVVITSPQYDSATLQFEYPIGDVSSVNLTVLKTQDTSQTLFYPDITSPFLITGLQPNVTYDISLSSFYESSQGSYLVYKPAFFKTFYENYPVFISATDISNTSVTITFSFTATPSSNTLLLTNANNIYDTSFSKINIPTNSELISLISVVNFTGLHLDTSYNLQITSFYNFTGHIYPITFTNVFHTLNESQVYVVNITVLLGNLITFTFIPASGNVLEYVIYLTDTNGNNITQTYEIYPESVTFYELTSSMNYTLTIISNYTTGNSYTYNYPSVIQTLYEGPVKEMTYSNVTNSSAIISFTRAPGAVSTYNIYYQGQRNNVTHYSITGLTNTQNIFSLINLAIFTPYTIIINTIYGNGHTYEYTFSNLFTTLNQGPSSIVNIAVYTNYVDIIFINTYGYPSSFIFEAKPSNSPAITGYESIINVNTEYTYTLIGLSPSTSYTVSIKTLYDNDTVEYITTYPNPITTL